LPKKLNQDIDLFLALVCSNMLFWVISFIQIFFNLIEMFLDILSYNCEEFFSVLLTNDKQDHFVNRVI
jgi:hypothetical protein